MSRWRSARAILVTVVGAAFLLAPAPAPAAALLVTTLADQYNTGPECALREAIKAANDNASFGGCTYTGDDEVRFDPALAPGTATLSLTGAGEDAGATGDLDVTGSVTITGEPGITVQGSGDRIFHATGSAGITIDELTLTGGASTAEGGAIFSSGADVTVLSSVVSGNSAATLGGGISVITASSPSTVTIRDSTIGATNSAQWGGGIYVNGTSGSTLVTLNIENTTLTGNTATYGGGLAVAGGVIAEVEGSLINSNFASDRGDGIYSGSMTNGVGTTIRDSTIANNGASAVGDEGGGIYQQGTLTLTNVTMSNNEGGASSESGAHIHHGFGTLTLRNVLMDDSPISAACVLSGTTNYAGTNQVEAPDNCGAFTQVSDAQMQPLGDNGGATDTIAVAAASPAVGAGGSAFCDGADQRGAPRQGDCEVGAYEFATCGGKPVDIIGTAGSDDMLGTAGNDTALLLDGSDEMRGLGGRDSMCGGQGRDTLEGGTGNDFMDGGGGNDTCAGGPGTDKARACERTTRVP